MSDKPCESSPVRDHSPAYAPTLHRKLLLPVFGHLAVLQSLTVAAATGSAVPGPWHPVPPGAVPDPAKSH